MKKDQEMQQIRQQLESLQQDLRVMKAEELRRLKDLVYGRKKFEQEVVEEMKRTGKDFGTVLSEKLDPDVMMSHIKNDKKIPSIYRDMLDRKQVKKPVG